MIHLCVCVCMWVLTGVAWVMVTLATLISALNCGGCLVRAGAGGFLQSLVFGTSGPHIALVHSFSV